jgi:hypothetical protein
MPVPPPQRIYATPTPAPSESNPMPPAAAPSTKPEGAATPGVKESSSYYGSLATAGSGDPSRLDRCSIGFWNGTQREVTLKVQGQLYRLPAGRGLTLDLPRRFIWQMEDREPKLEELPSSQSALDIVMRR